MTGCIMHVICAIDAALQWSDWTKRRASVRARHAFSQHQHPAAEHGTYAYENAA